LALEDPEGSVENSERFRAISRGPTGQGQQLQEDERGHTTTIRVPKNYHHVLSSVIENLLAIEVAHDDRLDLRYGVLNGTCHESVFDAAYRLALKLRATRPPGRKHSVSLRTITAR